MRLVVEDREAHPGLLLDKWHEYWRPAPERLPRGATEQEKERYRREKREFDEFARTQLERVTKAAGDAGLLRGVGERLKEAAGRLEGRCWRRKTKGPLTLHLARAGSFENAGICLHPLYGFAYLPGSGIKGMARAYARNVAGARQADMEAVFGKDTTRQEQGWAGGVVFYDALPVGWPKLVVDIVNSHHGKYYRGEGPPEDWEDPVPVNFLAVAPGTEFEFRVAARRRSSEAAGLLELAQGWIDGGLAWLGAGAKTNAGYGRFTTGAELPAESGRTVFTCKLTLVSPAFLAGALQGRQDCTLRPATLRGLLRWWWRTLHAGYVSVDELRQMEGKLWGNTERDGAIGLEVEPVLGAEERRKFDFPRPQGRGLAPGRFYLAYGMEGIEKQGKAARFYVKEGAQWRVRFVCRPVDGWSSEVVLDQAVLALWMLATYGGVGAKCRRGFGSVDIAEPTMSLPADRNDALRRARLIRGGERGFSNELVESPSVEKLECEVLGLGSWDVWEAVDRLGEGYRSFTASEKRKPEKLRLGLPRNIGRRKLDQRSLKHPHGGEYTRHASPLHFRLVRGAEGYSVRVTALPSPHLPSLGQSQEYLRKCVEYMKRELGR
jgi:CRISPR-associated protein Cmr6